MSAWPSVRIGRALDGWRRYSSERAQCPGCAANSEPKPAHELCRHKAHEHGELVACRKLEAEPAGWKRLRTDSKGCAVYFVPRDLAAPAPFERATREQRKPQAPKLAGEELVEFVEALTSAAPQLARVHRSDVEEFYRSRAVPFDPRLYCVGPSKLEALDVVKHLRARGRLVQGAPGVVGDRGEEVLVVHKRGEAWEFTLDAEGRRVGWSRRLLRPDKSKREAKSPAPCNSSQHLHHSLAWRARVAERGVLVVTEGTRKANEIARRTGLAAVGAPGVDLARVVRAELEALLRSTRPGLVLLAPDFADLRNGERGDEVRRAVSGWAWIVELVREWGGEVRGLTWERDEKGLDDVLAALNYEGDGLPTDVRARTWSEYLEAFRWLDVSLVAPASESETRPREVSAFTPQRPTREIVRTAEDAQRVSREIAASWTSGENALHFAGWPGLGKTVALGRVELERLATRSKGYECGVGVHALPTREIVREKASALREQARERGLEVEVVELLGKSWETESPWTCAAPARAQQRAELRRPSCAGCELKANCESTEGNYRHTRAGVVRLVKKAARGGRPVLVVGTFGALRDLREIPDEAPLVLDDVPVFESIFTRCAIKSSDLRSALERLGSWLASKSDAPSFPIGEEGDVAEVHVAPFVRGVLEAIGSRSARRNVEAFVRNYEPAFLEALRAGRVRPSYEGWSWEDSWPDDGHDGRPAFSSLALDSAREILRDGGTFEMRRLRTKHDFELVLPSRFGSSELLERVRAGRVAWLSVAPLAPTIAEGLGVRSELVHANPEHLELVVGEHAILGLDGRERLESFGRTLDGDAIVRQFVSLLESSGSWNLGAIVSKADHAALDELAVFVRVVHYGAGHASTDKLADCELVVVRRHARPYDELTFEARCWRALLGLPESALAGKVALEPRRWSDASTPVASCVPADPLERELLEADEAGFMLNALGRARPLTATSRRLVLVLNGRPFNLHGASVRVAPLAVVARELGVELELPTEDSRKRSTAAANASKAVETARLLERARELVEGNPFASHRWLAAELGIKERRARRLLEQVQAPTLGQLAPLLGTVRGLLEARGKIRPPSHRDTETASKPSGAELSALPTVEAVVEELGEYAPTSRTVRTHLGAIREALRTGSPLLPRRSDKAAGLAAVLRAAAHLLERDAFELVPEPAPSNVRPMRAPLRLAVGLAVPSFASPPSPELDFPPCSTTTPSSNRSVSSSLHWD